MHAAHRARSSFSSRPSRASAWCIPRLPPFPVWLSCAVTLFLAFASSLHAQVIATGNDHTCTAASTGVLVCWGSNQYGQLGDGTTTTRPQPVNVQGLEFSAPGVAGGWGQSCAVTSAGAVKCWGWNQFGQLGNGGIAQSNTPVQASGISSGATRVVAGYGHTCALVSGGVKCWGGVFAPDPNQGQTGNGGTTGSLSPQDVSGLGAGSGVTSIAAGKNHTCAITAAGGVKCWGANEWDQLGNNDATHADRTTPVDVAGLSSGVIAVAGGGEHTCALTSGGGVKCWGQGQFGALGDGTAVDRMVPVDVSGLSSGAIAITAGTSHSCALLAGGAVKCWGSNGFGQVGDGTNTQRNAPVQVLSSGAVAVAAGSAFTCALLSGGGSQCWGANANGQMGNGSVGGPSYVPAATVYPASTATALATNGTPSTFGDNVTLTATVTGGVNGVAVAFRDGGTDIAGCAARPLAAGTTTCVTNALAAGAHSITAVYKGDAATLASISTVLSQSVNKADQTIVFDALANKPDTDPPFPLSATASSGLAVAFSSTTTVVCTVSGNNVTLVAAGTCTIAANQAGNASYNAAPQVARSFNVISSGPALALLSVNSRKVHGSAGAFDLPINFSIPLAGSVDVEPRAIGAGHTLVFEFNNTVTSVGTVTCTDAASTAVGTAASSISGSNVIVTLTGIPDNKRVTVTLPAVNGTLAASASLGFLVGDVNNSRSVNTTDISGVRARNLQPLTSANFKYDLNASGSINTTDVSAVRARSLAVLP